ncbi:hypothetical protein Tco_0938188 [Tanacetum coccineum]|uniref:Protein TIC 214 n=1 Tax=Tanacetum coccineum TaxID=301880 RepID=A0ABQ5DJ64_9ASTR
MEILTLILSEKRCIAATNARQAKEICKESFRYFITFFKVLSIKGGIRRDVWHLFDQANQTLQNRCYLTWIIRMQIEREDFKKQDPWINEKIQKGECRVMQSKREGGFETQLSVVLVVRKAMQRIRKDTENKMLKTVILKDRFMEKVFANVALKNELRKLKGNSMDTKFAKPSILGKSVLKTTRNQSVVRQPNAFKSERPNFSKPRFASQVDVNNDLSKLVTQHYLPKTTLLAPLLKEKKSVRFSALYLQKKRNLLKFNNAKDFHNWKDVEAKLKSA